MKLTKLHKECFVSAVMRDIPKPDFGEQFTKIIVKDMDDQASPTLKGALAIPELRGLILTGNYSYRPDSVQLNNTYYSAYALDIHPVTTYHDYVPSAKVKAAEKLTMDAAIQNHVERKALEAKITTAIFGCSTRKVALERMPEFEKYLPFEESASSFLPAIANLAADLVSAGWKVPKMAAV